MRAALTALTLTATLAMSTHVFAGDAKNEGGKSEAAQPAESEAPAQPAEEDVSESDKARANALFEEGRQAMAEGKVAEACSKFAASQKIRPGIGTLYNLADCNEKLGRTATAWKLFGEVADRTKAALQSEREQKARERMAVLEPKLVKLRLSVPSGGKVKLIKVDDATIPPEEYNKALPYDPGDHVVHAETVKDDGEPFEEEIDLSEEGKTVTVAIPVAAGAKMKPRLGMIIGGGVTMGVGALALSGAIYCGTADCDLGATVGLGVLGVAGLAVGIPIFAVGFKKKPVKTGEIEIVEPSPIPAVAVGPTGGSLTWHF